MHQRTSLFGVLIAFAAFALFPFHDAIVKWLVADYSIWQIMFIRSAIIAVFLCIWQGRGLVKRTVTSPVRRFLFLRAAVLIGAWSCYYSAARSLGLGELTTIYFASPIVVAMLAVPLLGEKVALSKWIAIGLGFVGVVIACRPNLGESTFAVLLALTAAGLWAYAVILVRQSNVAEKTTVNMLATNLGFVGLGLVMLPWHWVTPSFNDAILFIAMGVIGGAAQGLVFEAIRRAPASTIAPLEFTGLIWAFGLGYWIWNDVPDLGVVLGAALIVMSGAIVVGMEWRSSILTRRSAAKIAS
ncbi:drug/metabolite transporter (DMT)-like permease [Rhodoligotrophos appendicifer]|uniref:DMT family transporter n=1 Tax=Rhodoligotrophos appendicifer TaxID=987056 RepID=UPI001181568A|nr:DMT family transporter [Rhodoligotrophos appendicifer]